MAPVTERFVVRPSAPAQRHPVPDGIRFPVSRNNRDAATYPDRPVLTACRVFNEDYGLLQLRLNGRSGLPVFEDKAAGRAVACLFYSLILCLRASGFFRQVPDPGRSHAEPGM